MAPRPRQFRQTAARSPAGRSPRRPWRAIWRARWRCWPATRRTDSRPPHAALSRGRGSRASDAVTALTIAMARELRPALADSVRTDRRLFRRLHVADPRLVELRAWSRLAEELTEERVRLGNRVDQPRQALKRRTSSRCSGGGSNTSVIWVVLNRCRRVTQASLNLGAGRPTDPGQRVDQRAASDPNVRQTAALLARSRRIRRTRHCS